jgi:hypothetical protein
MDAMPETVTMIRDQIAGTDLSAATFVWDCVQLDFDGPKVNVLTPMIVSSSRETVFSKSDQLRNRLCEQIGKLRT